MDGFNGEMLLDVEKRATDSLRPLNISISPPERNVSGRFFNFHDYKPTFKLDASEKGRVTLTGGPLMAPYIMDQFHFHVYCTREEAEENTLDRVQVPGEVSEKMSVWVSLAKKRKKSGSRGNLGSLLFKFYTKIKRWMSSLCIMKSCRHLGCY